MPTIKELREERAGIWAQAQEFNERAKKGDPMSGEDEAAWERALAKVDELGTQIENREKSEKLDKRFADIDADTVVVNPTGDPGGSRDQYAEAFVKYCRGGIANLDAEERSLMEANFRDQGIATGGAGGYTVPQGFWAKVTETLKAYANVATIAETVNTDAGNALPWATNDDTSNVGELLSENTAAANQDLTFGQKTLNAFMYSSKMIPVSRQLLQDTGIDIEAFIAKKAGQRLGRIVNQHFTTGTGGGTQPQGYVTGATTGKTGTTGQTTTVIYDDLVDLIHSVDAAYRQSEQCRWAMHDLSLAIIRKLKDSQNRPLWQPAISLDSPDTLLGYPISINNAMATMAANAKSIAFGAFSAGYVVRTVSGGQLLRLDERFAEKLQVGFLGFGRYDGLTQDASAVKLYVNSAT
ncbi:MAG TPA: phage major capsid protein [Acidimicrobiales bacterium]|nr:phage major capsid protein [Acidimicrobiales bacterium]